MTYLRLSNATTDSCDFKVKLSNDFNRNYYKRLRITSTNYGSSTSSVNSYVESITARNSSSRYVRGVVNEGMSAGRTYTLYAYAQARNGTWYRAGSDAITMENGGSNYDSNIGKIYNFKVRDESSSQIYFSGNIMDSFDYLKVDLNGSHLIDLHRGNNYRGPDGYNILRGDGDLFKYMISGLSPNTPYTIKVVAYRNNGDYGKTYEDSDRTKAAAPVVTPPTNIKATAKGLKVTINFRKGRNNDKVEISDIKGSRILARVSGTTATINLANFDYLYNKKYTLRLRGVSGSNKSEWIYTNRFQTGSKPSIKRGDKGDLVTALQQDLYELGLLEKSDIVGSFGPKTEAAVKKFQKMTGLRENGEVDSVAKNKLKEDLNWLHGDAINEIRRTGLFKPFGGVGPLIYALPNPLVYDKECIIMKTPKMVVKALLSVRPTIGNNAVSVDFERNTVGGGTIYGKYCSVDVTPARVNGQVRLALDTIGVKIADLAGGLLRAKIKPSFGGFTVFLEYCKTINHHNFYQVLEITYYNFKRKSNYEVKTSSAPSHIQNKIVTGVIILGLVVGVALLSGGIGAGVAYEAAEILFVAETSAAAL